MESVQTRDRKVAEEESPKEKPGMPEDMFRSVISYLSSVELLYLREVCHGWKEMGVSEDAWEGRKLRLWQGRYVALDLQEMQESSFKSFWFSVQDSKRSIFRNLDEICGPRKDMPPGIWCFRFKAQAGGFWREHDPWWKGGEAIRLRLHEDGSMETVTDAPYLWGQKGSKCGSYFVKTENGRSVVTENGRAPMVLYRHPVHWGLYLHSCWTVWTSFPMQPPGKDLFMEDYWLSVGPGNPMHGQNFASQTAKTLQGL